MAAQRKLVAGERFDRRHVASVAARWLDGDSRLHMLRARNARSRVKKLGLPASQVSYFLVVTAMIAINSFMMKVPFCTGS